MIVHTANENIELWENLFERDHQVLTHLSLDQGQEVPTHDHPWKVVVVIYKGRVDFTGENGSQTIVPGQVVEMEGSEDHSLKALEASQLMVIKSQLKE